MKRFLLFLTVFLISLPSYAIYSTAEKGDDGLRYSLIKTIFDNSPLLKEPDKGAERFTYLKKNITFYAKEYNSGFYKVDSGLKAPLWIERKNVTLVKKLPDGGGARVSEIKLYGDRKNYLVKIKTKDNIFAPFTMTGENKEINFKLYNLDTRPKAGTVYKAGSLPYKIKNANKKKEGGEFNVSVLKNGGYSNVLCVDFKSGVPVFSYDVEKENKVLVLKVRKPLKIPKKKPLKNVKVALDPGHGGYDSGIVSRGVKEKDLNLLIAKKLRKALKKRGAKVVLTRKKDIDMTSSKRIEISNNKKADYLISIHQNTLKNPDEYKEIHGVHTYYYNDNAKNLAYSIQQSLVRATDFKDDGVTSTRNIITQNTSPVSVLVKPGYLINSYERVKLSDDKFQTTVANAIANGLERHLKSIRNHHYKNIKDVKRHKNL